MLDFVGRGRRYCDGVNRRSFLRVGGLALGGLSLPTLLKAEAEAGIARSHKAIIMVYLSGGMAHQDTFDPKPDAPDEVRGEFNPIDTNLPGADLRTAAENGKDHGQTNRHPLDCRAPQRAYELSERHRVSEEPEPARSSA